ncbi:TPA: site-specific DNA-methyltransferase, partial [Streptococcus equi subsp. equi]|nr:site-specific DNA-methyltransferase [Streptococcus equi subsp. equi]
MKCELYNDHFENAKRYNIPRAQLIIADIPYNLGNNAYASDPRWYENGSNKNGESKLAGKSFFDTDNDFKINNFFNFCARLLKKEPKEKGKAPAMIVFHSWQQRDMVIQCGKKHGFNNAYPLYFTKKSSPQVLKANMKIVGATEEATVLYRDKLPKFNNNGSMVLNHMVWEKDSSYPTIHPTQKPIPVLKRLIEIFTDP